MKAIIILSCSFVLSVSYFNKTKQKHDIGSFIGTWKGTSLCQQKNSPCHDEVVVYYITKGNGADSCVIQANKIVNGVEEDMGPLPCKFDKNKNELNSTAYNSIWNFKLKDEKISGTLYVRNNLYRIIELAKQNK
jgi:hypothetical protein